MPWQPPEKPTEPLEPVHPPQQRKNTGRVVIASFLAALVGGATGTAAMLAVRDDRPAPPVVVQRTTTPPPATANQDGPGVSAVAQKVMPSIVLINTSFRQGRLGSGSGTGSGVIFTPDGYILTNNHVIEGARSIEVTLSTGEKLSARLVGSASPVDDIAVIKVDKTGLPAATLGSTADVKVGDLAVALGSPFGLQGSVTAGIVSALHRNINLGQQVGLTDAIQTDAPINPGNSGGALADSQGRVIGINTAIVGSGSNAGVGFAIPIDIARGDAEQIIRTGRADRPLMGISGEGVPAGGGALIQSVEPDGPAARAGLQAGDTVVQIERSKVESMDELIRILRTFKSGQTVTVTYKRGSETRTTQLTFASSRGG